MKFVDHSRNYPMATKASFVSGIPKIHHNSDGGRLWRRSETRNEVHVEFWRCDSCRQEWKWDCIAGMTADQIECRFHLRGDTDSDAYVIVWTVTGKNKHTTLVRARDADKYERFVL